jgi:hypothetical protein
MVIFIDEDASYLQWVQQNPDRFVLNAHRSPKPDYLRLHKSTCNLISGVPANGIYWTTTYLKVCGDRHELEAWASGTVGGEVWACERCM